ncbi:phosphoribosyltransferase domain-containing protein [Psychrobacillus sp. OK032]|uniref:phosphoribosyltransferase domain-containing protein n=1 Tax=Psychrobacillus sp. OK032 TaxID=1884358 RepID=UPI000ADC5AB5|nr:phosphoribosyltransferase domain-containing protein [Psychrobacillus sp. OK032]
MLHHSTSSNILKTYNLHGDLKLTIEVKNNPNNFSPEALFEMGVRINKKRSFLFVSRLLGKHLAVDPAISLGTGSILASMLLESEGEKPLPHLIEIVEMVNSGVPDRALSAKSLAYKAKLPTKTVFIGFAETATGLGHAVFHHFHDATYIHTTREEIINLKPSFYFEEEHSHATSHRVYAPEEILMEAETIVLVDDEITTGLTASNLIAALNESFPGKQYKVLSILDWRNDDQQIEFNHVMKARGISAEVISILSGQFSLSNETSIEEKELTYLNEYKEFEVFANEALTAPFTSTNYSAHAAYNTFTGRFGLTADHHEEMEEWIKQLINTLPSIDRNKSTLVIGVGENIYIPLRFALAFGKETKVQTTTRSPIFAKNEKSYPIKQKCKFTLPDSNGIDQYVYNLSDVAVEQIIVIAESVKENTSWFPLLTHLETFAPVTWVSLTMPYEGGE